MATHNSDTIVLDTRDLTVTGVHVDGVAASFKWVRLMKFLRLHYKSAVSVASRLENR